MNKNFIAVLLILYIIVGAAGFFFLPREEASVPTSITYETP